ncbi:hypothetical protein CEXT_700381 [Caerostris extrusa]|uniref:Uncharacterized protein n=1 Tax=Caerostris extrusa TaxID=172846 RepID=A0AAV4RWD1_CAEEX|nr:hypothetical protein CEXT_700381 [Caerostris extrusa]
MTHVLLEDGLWPLFHTPNESEILRLDFDYAEFVNAWLIDNGSFTTEKVEVLKSRRKEPNRATRIEYYNNAAPPPLQLTVHKELSVAPPKEHRTRYYYSLARKHIKSKHPHRNVFLK